MTATENLFVRAARGKTAEKPVWMMRQAGRYLPEYRELRAHFPDFLAFVRNVEASVEATLQPIKRFDLDAAILFSDILVTLPPMGFDLRFVPGKGPVISNPVRSIADVKNLWAIDPAKALAYTGEALQKIRAQLSVEKALLGFVGGPLTIASYAIEGGTSKDLHKTKALYYTAPETYRAFLDLIAQVTGEYLAFQAAQGADALVIMDSWAGNLSAADYNSMAKPFTAKVLEIVRLKTDAPIIHYANGAAHLVDEFLTLRPDVLGVDHRSELGELFAKYPGKIFQGNLDQALLFAAPDEIVQRTRQILKLAEGRPHIMNLGHGVLPETPIEGVLAFIRAARGE